MEAWVSMGGLAGVELFSESSIISCFAQATDLPLSNPNPDSPRKLGDHTLGNLGRRVLSKVHGEKADFDRGGRVSLLPSRAKIQRDSGSPDHVSALVELLRRGEGSSLCCEDKLSGEGHEGERVEPRVWCGVREFGCS